MVSKCAPVNVAVRWLAKRAEIEQQEMTLLAAADARMSEPGHRRQQLWKAAGQR